MTSMGVARRGLGIRWLGVAFAAATAGTFGDVMPALARHGELPNRIPEAAPYNVAEAKHYPPPYEQYFSGSGNPGFCGSCHQQIFSEWNGSMMSNAWRDPAWRGAFLLISRLTATDGNCDIPDPPDGTKKSHINPFANENCTSTFDIGKPHTTRGSGSLLDGFCSRCHMPSNYIDAVKPKNVTKDKESGLEHGLIDPDFDPTSARGTQFAFATLGSKRRNTESGQLGITCTFCHTMAETRHTPFHNYEKSGTEYYEAKGKGNRLELLPVAKQELLEPADGNSPTLGYGVGAGAYRVSPQALAKFERFGPLTHANRAETRDPYVSGAFQTDVKYQKGAFKTAPHKGNYNVLFERAEMCATCHDVTNPLTIKNKLGKWVGGFPIERTYTEWSSSRYADRPGNQHFDPKFKRDCQTCHMQQDYGEPGTAQTLFGPGGAAAPRPGTLALNVPERPVTFSHHFVGGNTYSTMLVGANATKDGKPEPWPELSKYSYSSADPKSIYYNAVWENFSETGPPTQHQRMAWDRLRHAVELELTLPGEAAPGKPAPIAVKVVNSGTGHNFPTGFPEGRNAWVAVRAFDLGTNRELEIDDSFWKRRSLGVGYLTDEDMIDPNFPGCKWKAPAGSPDPYAWQFRAVASLGNGCPTLDLPYAAPLNLTLDDQGFPVDRDGQRIDRKNPLGLPQFKDVDKDGDLFDDSFLIDNRLRPLPHPQATLKLDRYSVVIPEGAVGPIAVSAAVYYQSMEAMVAKKFMGNMADTDQDHVLEPCVLKGACDGRTPKIEPAVVEGAPPVPMRVESNVIHLRGARDVTPPRLSLYPEPNFREAYRDVVVKVTTSEPVTGIDRETFTLSDAKGNPVPARVAQIDDFTWALFPNQVFLDHDRTYHAKLAGAVCDSKRNCTDHDVTWQFSIAPKGYGRGDTRSPARPSAAPLEAVAYRPGVDLPASWRGLWLGALGLMIGLGAIGLAVWFGPEDARGRRLKSIRPPKPGN